MSKKALISVLALIFPFWLYSQCDPVTPIFSVNLTGAPSGTWVSPAVVRDGACCDQSARCIKIVVTLDPLAAGITFAVASGANPGGALAYEVNCVGPPTPSGGPICLPGGATYTLTFCKVGNNQNTYQLTSIPGVVAGTDIIINDGCTKGLSVTGLNPTTTTWNSIAPGTPGQYNSYLSCTSGCLNPTVTASGSPPPFVDYVVCGQPAAQCNFTPICDTIRVTFNPTLGVTILPQNPTICFGQTATTVTAIGSGGTPPYSYLWNNVNPSQTINVGVGTYNVQLSDNSGCPPVYNSVSVTAFSVAITANAGPNQTKCIQSPLATLNGTVTGASGGIWSGGTGTYTPNNTTLSNLNYYPSAAELAAGFANLILTTTGNGTCPPKNDTIRINYQGFIGVPTPTVTNVSCFGGANGSATVTMTGGPTPYTYLWNTAPTQTTASAANLPIGTYSVTIQDGIGCILQTTVAIIQPPPLAISGTVANVTCSGATNGSVTVAPTGGTPPYSYTWTPTAQSTATASNLPAGIYSVNVVDSQGCQITSSYTVTQPLPIAITHTHTNVSCFNGTDGTVTTTVTGGTAPFTYSWSPGGNTSQNPTGLAAGNYTLTVTDNFSCVATSTVAITQPTLLVASTTVINETCDYLNNGSINTTVTGGTPGYTYSWSPGGQITSNISGQASGTYTVLITDTKSCTAIVVSTITEPLPLTVSFNNQINVSCFGGSDGSVGASASGGTPNYTYSWSPVGTTNSTASGLPIGTYTVAVTDNNSCLITNTVTITQPTDIVVTGTTTNVFCNGGSNGTIATTVTGGVSPYTYFWPTGGQTTSSVSGLTAGTYSVIVTDFNGCQKTLSYTITQPLPLAIAFTSTNVSCFGGSNAIINSSVTGGTTTYSYTWSPGGQTTQNVSGLPIGTYTLNVLDALNCPVSNTIIITEPAPLTVSPSSTNETCNYLNNGTASVFAGGGTPAYSYSWQPGGQTTSSVSGLASGSYTAIITDSELCMITTTVLITEPTPLAITFTDQINVSCFGGNNGSIGSISSGGTPNYTYSWLPGGATTNAIFNISAGTYSLTITDNNGCVFQNTVAISQPTLPLTVSATSTSVTCNGGSNGSITSNAVGGTPIYSYVLDPGNLSGQTITSLVAGTFTIQATDNNGCLATNTISVIEPAPIIPVTTSTNSTCGNSNGIGAVTVTGGVAPYTYSWTPGASTNTLVTGLLAGAYTVTVKDANNCTAMEILLVNDTGGPNTSIFSTTNVSCFGGNDGTATAAVIGGVAPITYTWSPTGGNGLVATGLTAGTYYITAEDANGCVSLAMTSPDIIQPPAIESDILTSNVSCFGGTNGTATVIATGGTPGYTYTWVPSAATGSTTTGLAAGIFSVQVQDSKNCIHTNTFSITQPTAALAVTAISGSISCFGGSDGTASSSVTGGTFPYNYSWNPGNISGQNISNLPQGIYTITATDIQGCVANNTVTVIQPTAITLATISANSNCGAANGQATVTASGGMGSYTYTWSPQGGNGSIATALLSGSYSVVVNDINGCVKSTSLIVADNPGPIVTVASTTSVSCFGGNDATATASVIGGTGPFTYTWSPIGGNNPTASGLPIGTYTVNITAANGCLASAVSSTIIQPTPLFLNVVTSNVSCFSGANGSATVTAGGGIPGYTYTWLPSNVTGSTTSGLSAGVFSVQVRDANNCVYTTTYSISQPTAALASTTSFTSVSCFAGNNGIASAQATGGTVPYSYNWLPMNTNTQTVTGLTTGTYTVNITDNKGCTTSNTVLVTQPAQPLSATGNGSPTFCFGGSNGTATVTASGGTAGYTYTWSPNGGNNPTASGLSPGNYLVNIGDAKGCQTNVSVIISQPTAVTGTLYPYNPACAVANGSITSQITGGTGPYTYSWSPNPGFNSSIIGLLPGTYTLLTTDALGCTKTLTTSLVNLPPPTVTLISTINDSCFGGNNGKATISISSGNPPYSINWLPYGGNTTTASLLVAGSYTANVTDSRGCLTSVVANITQPTPVAISISSVTNVSCFGGNNGSITVSGSGGTPGYTFTWLPSNFGGSTIINLSAGTYSVRANDAHNCPAIISVGISQPATLVSSNGGLINPVCYNGTGSATVNVSGGTIPYSYTWTSVPAQNGNVATNITSGTYTAFVNDANGCAASTVFSLTQPTQVITTAGVNDTICLSSSGIVTASASGGSGGYYFNWQPTGSTNNGTFSVTPTSNTTYTVIAYDVNGCAGNPDTVSAIVYNLTAADIDAIAYSPICPGQSTTIYATTAGVQGPLSYNWNNGLGTGPGAFVVAPSQPTTYVLTVTNSCGGTVTDSVRVLFNPPPTIVASSQGTLTCIPSALNFIDSSITGNPADPISSWNWNFGDGQTSNQQNPMHTYTNAGTYSVTLTVTTSNGCTNNNGSSPIVINAYNPPIAAFSTNPPSPITLNLPYDILTCSNQSSPDVVSFSWNFGEGGTSSLANPTYQYNTVGIYTIQLVVTNQYGCTDTASVQVVTDAEIIFPNAFTPNTGGSPGGYFDPMNNNNDIFFPVYSGIVEYKLQIFNRWGELIFESDDVKQGWDGYYRNKICQVGVYVWKANAKFNNGKKFSGSGDVTLLK